MSERKKSNDRLHVDFIIVTKESSSWSEPSEYRPATIAILCHISLLDGTNEGQPWRDSGAAARLLILHLLRIFYIHLSFSFAKLLLPVLSFFLHVFGNFKLLFLFLNLGTILINNTIYRVKENCVRIFQLWITIRSNKSNKWIKIPLKECYVPYNVVHSFCHKQRARSIGHIVSGINISVKVAYYHECPWSPAEIIWSRLFCYTCTTIYCRIIYHIILLLRMEVVCLCFKLWVLFMIK